MSLEETDSRHAVLTEELLLRSTPRHEKCEREQVSTSIKEPQMARSTRSRLLIGRLRSLQVDCLVCRAVLEFGVVIRSAGIELLGLQGIVEALNSRN